MATGLLATAIACVKLFVLYAVTHQYALPDSLRDNVGTALWSKLEEQVGIIAACMPCLKRPAEEILRRIGILGEEHWPNMSKPSFVRSFRTREESIAPEVSTQMPLQDVGKLIHKESQGSELGRVSTKSTEWSGIILQSTAGSEIPATYKKASHTQWMEHV
jgi:Fungal rhodopsin domain